ncbi:anti-sigma factor antagonist [Roseivivax halodurans JCM 10272]|uniref:Anti-sigma factor antagonist n=1 Tax=Roseivivax halodurans JCM 10272 TaxID=1449350 RepID=X7EA30_9RHOB|nr:STAS domain-containing protein [Roseivivax halodurans]ETX11973.1 anti-sigma factor antagonist [Roseivivax halodurans JCM 10272]
MPVRHIHLVLDKERASLLRAWGSTQAEEGLIRKDLFSEREARSQIEMLYDALTKGVSASVEGDMLDPEADCWDDLRAALAEVTRERTKRGVSTGDMAAFVLALKYPLFERLGATVDDTNGRVLIEAINQFTRLIDAVSLYTTELCISERDKTIKRQRDEMMELASPVVELWDRVIAVPLVGTLDSMRAQEVMENTLSAIVEKKADIVIIDITGVVTVDTQVAQHLIRTAAAVRLMGAEAIISGISPRIAQTMVQLGVDTGEVRTRSSLRMALADAFRQLDTDVVVRNAR